MELRAACRSLAKALYAWKYASASAGDACACQVEQQTGLVQTMSGPSNGGAQNTLVTCCWLLTWMCGRRYVMCTGMARS